MGQAPLHGFPVTYLAAGARQRTWCGRARQHGSGCGWNQPRAPPRLALGGTSALLGSEHVGEGLGREHAQAHALELLGAGGLDARARRLGQRAEALAEQRE